MSVNDCPTKLKRVLRMFFPINSTVGCWVQLFTSVSGEDDNVVNVLCLVVELLVEADLPVAGSDLESVDVVLERVADHRVAAAVHVLGSQLKHIETLFKMQDRLDSYSIDTSPNRAFPRLLINIVSYSPLVTA